MPCESSIDVPLRLVRTRAWGELTEQDLLDHQKRLVSDPQFDASFSQLFDCTGVTGVRGVSASLIKEGAQQTVFGAGAKRAIVTGNTVGYGLGRMFETYRSLADGHERIRVCQSIEEALAWLAGPAPQA
jgi:hypothetical protein